MNILVIFGFLRRQPLPKIASCIFLHISRFRRLTMALVQTIPVARLGEQSCYCHLSMISSFLASHYLWTLSCRKNYQPKMPYTTRPKKLAVTQLMVGCGHKQKGSKSETWEFQSPTELFAVRPSLLGRYITHRRKCLRQSENEDLQSIK